MIEALFVAMVVAASSSADPASTARLHALFTANYDFVWRFIRRLGVADSAVDDATQDAFLVVARRLDAIQPGKEKAFLFGTAVRIAADARRRAKRLRLHEDDAVAALGDPSLGVGELIDRERARVLFDHVLARMPLELRAVFVLHEAEDMTMAEIASHLELAPGTVASRLRRARAQFETAVARLEAR